VSRFVTLGISGQHGRPHRSPPTGPRSSSGHGRRCRGLLRRRRRRCSIGPWGQITRSNVGRGHPAPPPADRPRTAAEHVQQKPRNRGSPTPASRPSPQLGIRAGSPNFSVIEFLWRECRDDGEHVARRVGPRHPADALWATARPIDYATVSEMTNGRKPWREACRALPCRRQTGPAMAMICWPMSVGRWGHAPPSQRLSSLGDLRTRRTRAGAGKGQIFAAWH